MTSPFLQRLRLLCRHPWPLARTRAANQELSADRPSTLRVCARPVRAACRPRAQEASRDGQLSAPCGLRIRAYGSPLARSASGRVLSPRYAAIWPMQALSGARVRHASRPGSGAHPTRGRPVCYRHVLVRARTVHRPARAAKHSPRASPRQTPHIAGTRHAAASNSNRHPLAPTRSRLRAATTRSDSSTAAQPETPTGP